MLIRINRGVANSNSYCYWSVDGGQIFEGGIYHDREWSAILGNSITIKAICLSENSDSAEITLGRFAKTFNFPRIYLFVNKSPVVIHQELSDIRTQVLAWFNTIDKHEDFVIDLDSEILFRKEEHEK